MKQGWWKPDEIEKFECSLKQHGNDYTRIIAEHVRTRSLHAIARQFDTTYVKDKDADKFWKPDEIQKFADAVREFGDNCLKISEFMGTKSES